jgi:hypothetical protein
MITLDLIISYIKEYLVCPFLFTIIVLGLK